MQEISDEERLEALLLEYEDDSDDEQDYERLEQLLSYDEYPMEIENPEPEFLTDKKAPDKAENCDFAIIEFEPLTPCEKKEPVNSEKTEEELEYDELERILEKELMGFESSFPYVASEKFDPDKDLREIEYLMENPGAILLEEVPDKLGNEVEEIENLESVPEDFNRRLSLNSRRLTCQPVETYRTEFSVSEISYSPSQLLKSKLPTEEFPELRIMELIPYMERSHTQGMIPNFDDPFLLTVWDRNKCVQDMNGTMQGGWTAIFNTIFMEDFLKKVRSTCKLCNTHQIVIIMLFKTTRKWCDAWMKFQKALTVGNKSLVYGDYFADESIRDGSHNGEYKHSNG